jgi:uncharacterized protein (DUF488 family)
MPTELLTIGYERHPTRVSLIRALQAGGVERLVDVRELPLSRRRGFSKQALSAALKRAGIAYEHHRELGNPKRYRDMYRSGRQTQGERGYWEHLNNGSYAALKELAGSLGDQRTCLLCYEDAVEDCHRALIIKALRKERPRLAITHL